LLVFDLRNGVGRLRRIVDDAGTELGERCGFERCGKSEGECGNDQFFHCVSFRLWLMVGGTRFSCRDTVLLLCGKNFSLELRKTVGLWLAPHLSLFPFGFENRRLFCGQPLSSKKSRGSGSVFVQASLGIRRVFGVVLILRPLHLFSVALAARKG